MFYDGAMKIISKIFRNPEKRSTKRESQFLFLRETIHGHMSFIEFGPIVIIWKTDAYPLDPRV